MTVPTDLDHRFRDAAARSGLLDAAYDVFESPSASSSSRRPTAGSCASRSSRFDPLATIEEIARLAGRRVLRSGARSTAPAASSTSTSTARGVRSTSRSISAGQRRSRRRARRAREGPLRPHRDLRGAREPRREPEGRARGRDGDEPQPDPDRPPCHRIVGASGSLVGYAGGLERKEQLLRARGSDAVGENRCPLRRTGLRVLLQQAVPHAPLVDDDVDCTRRLQLATKARRVASRRCACGSRSCESPTRPAGAPSW